MLFECSGEMFIIIKLIALWFLFKPAVIHTPSSMITMGSIQVILPNKPSDFQNNICWSQYNTNFMTLIQPFIPIYCIIFLYPMVILIYWLETCIVHIFPWRYIYMRYVHIHYIPSIRWIKSIVGMDVLTWI